ncbi:MAG: PAS domain S-box protein [Halobacteriaceae archaeon]
MTSNDEPGPEASAVTAVSQEVAFAVDGDGTVADASERFWTATGLSRDDVLGADLAALEELVAEGLVRLRAAVDAVVRGRVSYERAKLALAAGSESDSRTTAVTARVTPLVDEGTVRGALVILEYDADESRRERELAETYQRYETLVEQSKDGVTITQDRKNVFVNDRFAEMVGYPKADLVGESFLKPITPADHETVERRYRRRIRGEHPPSRYELGLETNDGERLTVEVNVNRIRYSGEQATMATYRNITARKQREEELTRFRRAIETAPHAIYLTETDGTITYVNPAFEEVTGYSRGEALGRTPAILNSGKVPETVYEEMWDTISSGTVWEGYLVNRRASGKLYHSHQTVAPITDADGAVQSYVAIQTDVTERIERERLVDSLDHVLRHNLRNELNVIEGVASQNRLDFARDEKVVEALDE